MRSSLMALVNLEDFSFSFPPTRTDLPEEVPDVHFAMHHDRQSASEIIDEVCECRSLGSSPGARLLCVLSYFLKTGRRIFLRARHRR